MPPTSLKVAGAQDKGPPTPATRNCCLFVPALAPGVSQIVDVSGLGPYKLTGGDVVGITYTCLGGFVDLGHLRDVAGLTYYYYEVLTKRGGSAAGKTIVPYPPPSGRPPLGGYTMKTNIPLADCIDVAASMAFDWSVFYEFHTYWFDFPGMHNSSFSPEDLVSNFLGAYIATRALRLTSMTFEKAMTQEIQVVLNRLEARTAEQTDRAFSPTIGTWVLSIDPLFGALLPNFLRRRNFNFLQVNPCYVYVPQNGCGMLPTWPADIPRSFPSRITDYYEARFKLPSFLRPKYGEFLKRTDFVRAIADVKVDAESHYGADFECSGP